MQPLHLFVLSAATPTLAKSSKCCTKVWDPKGDYFRGVC